MKELYIALQVSDDFEMTRENKEALCWDMMEKSELDSYKGRIGSLIMRESIEELKEHSDILNTNCTKSESKKFSMPQEVVDGLTSALKDVENGDYITIQENADKFADMDSPDKSQDAKCVNKDCTKDVEVKE